MYNNVYNYDDNNKYKLRFLNKSTVLTKAEAEVKR